MVSDLPAAVRFSRMDTRQTEDALPVAMAFSDDAQLHAAF